MFNQKYSPIPPANPATMYIPEDRPVYRVGPMGFYGPDCRFYQEGDIVVWKKEPSISMYPLNEMAEEAYVELLQKLDKEGIKAADSKGKRFRTYMDRYMAEKNREDVESDSFLLQDRTSRQTTLLGEQEHTDSIELVTESSAPQPKRRGRKPNSEKKESLI